MSAPSSWLSWLYWGSFELSSLLATGVCVVVLWRGTSLALRFLGLNLAAAIGRWILPSDEVLRDIVARLRLRQRIRAQARLRGRRRLRRPYGRVV